MRPGRDLPTPRVGDEAVTPQQQHPAVGIAHDRARGLIGHPHDVMLEALAAGDLDVDEHEPDPLALVETSLAVHRPSHSPDCRRRLRSRGARSSGAVALRRPPVNRRAMSQAPTRSRPNAPAPTDWRRSRPVRPTVADRPSPCSSLAEFVALVFYMAISRPMWFYLDEWDFLANRTGVQPRRSLPRAQRALGDDPGARVPRAVVGRSGCTATGRTNSDRAAAPRRRAAVRMVMRRVGVRPWTATIVACILVFFGSGYQNIVLPVPDDARRLARVRARAAPARDARRRHAAVDRRDYYGLAAGAAALMCSGVGVSMVIAVGVAVLLAARLAARARCTPCRSRRCTSSGSPRSGTSGYTGYHAGLGQILSFVRTFVAATFGAMGHVTGRRRRCSACCSSSA